MGNRSSVKDLVSGLLLLAVAGGYYWGCGLIRHSSLSDSVGADGFPRALAFVLGGLALVLILKSIVLGVRACRRGSAQLQWDSQLMRSILRMLGLLALSIGYLLILPIAGYVLSLMLLLWSVIVYQGKRFSGRAVLVAAGGAFVFWVIFVMVLNIPLPAGAWVKWL
jgi:hypothetical protein